MSKNKGSTALEIVAGIISLVKGLIPAVLVAWNNYLRNQASRLKNKIIIMKSDKELKEKNEEITKAYSSEDSRGIINRYLSRRKNRLSADRDDNPE